MTLAFPKPARRGPRPRKAIRRGKPPARKSRPRPLRKGEAAEAKRAAAREWSRMVLSKAIGGWCAWCLSRKATDAAHIFAKGAHPSVRVDTANGIPLCRPCHQYGHAHPVWWLSWVRFHMGERRFVALEARAYGRKPADLAPSSVSDGRSAADGGA